MLASASSYTINRLVVTLQATVAASTIVNIEVSTVQPQALTAG